MRRVHLTTCVVDLSRGQAVRTDGLVVPLAEREVALVSYLVRHAPRAVSRDELLAEVWGFGPEVRSRAADTAIRRLRAKLEANPEAPEHFLTVHGEGYRLRLEDVAPTPTNLAAEDRPIVGRAAEVAELLELVRGPGLVTVVGPPGIGKTRLALAVAHASERPGGSWFCDLSDCADAMGVLQALGTALEVPLSGTRGVEGGVERLGYALDARGEALLVVDNCEQVAPQVAQILTQLAALAPETALLCTSRVPLRGEAERCVQPGLLPVDDAVTLFLRTARDVRPDYAPEGPELEDVVELVERLERLPLALVLAGGRMGALSPRGMLRRLEHRFRLLTSAARDAPDRSRTLRASVEVSWELLEAPERSALARCSVFRGGFTREAARQVIGAGADAALDTLVRHSLLRSDGTRLTAYAFVREFAEEALGAGLEGARGRHGAVFAELARVDRELVQLGPEWENLRAAARWAVASRVAEVAVPTTLAALALASRRGPLDAAVALAESCLALELAPADRLNLLAPLATARGRLGMHDGTPELFEEALASAESCGPAEQSRALRSRGMYRRRCGDQPGALSDLERAVQVARAVPEEQVLDQALSSLGILYREHSRRAESRACYEEVRARGTDRANLLHALGNLALLERREGRYARARALYEEAGQVAGDLHDLFGESVVMIGLGNLALDLGELDRAQAAYERSAELSRRLGLLHDHGAAEGNLGLVHRCRGDLAAARHHTERALAAFEKLADARHIAIARGNLGEVHMLAGELEQAEALMGGAVETLLQLRDVHGAAELQTTFAEIALRSGRRSDALERVEAAVAGARDSGNPLSLALALCALARVLHALGRDIEAVRSEALSLAAELGGAVELTAAMDGLRALSPAGPSQ